MLCRRDRGERGSFEGFSTKFSPGVLTRLLVSSRDRTVLPDREQDQG